MIFAPSELIINPDGSIYHLNVRPDQLAHNIILVGDPDRVPMVSKYFDTVEHKISRREFHTHTGTLNNTAITVLSTGIGTDNIDIVLNELDALVNIDFTTRTIKEQLTQLNIIRIGTSGAIQKEIPVDSFLISKKAVGFDSLLHWYKQEINDLDFVNQLREQLQLPEHMTYPYVVDGHEAIIDLFKPKDFYKGITLTNVGFYGPQGRALRAPLAQPNLNDRIHNFIYDGERLSNLEMETAGIFAMSRILGHRAASLNAILANRITGEFSRTPTRTIDRLIQKTLNIITQK